MSKTLRLPKGKYFQKIEVNDGGLEVTFAKRKKVALLFIAINERYWPYLKQVIEDCDKLFLKQHNVDYYVWTDIPKTDTHDYLNRVAQLHPQDEFNTLVSQNQRPQDQWWSRDVITSTVDFLRSRENIHLQEVEPVEWPAPTLMRYHLFLNVESELKNYDYVFYLDADMRVVDRISDEVLGPGLTAAPHPGYAVDKRFLPPLEPNPNSTAYIHRLGRVVDDGGKPRFMPFYAAGGFQGGVSKKFIAAMKDMKKSIDIDFNQNYTAIWNDESHWNRYLWDFQKKGGQITFLDPSYVYPDSLIKEYYIPLWGRDYPPKIITLTKPFSLSTQAGSELSRMIGATPAVATCPSCQDTFETPGYRVKRFLSCPGRGVPHQMDMEKV